MMKYFKDSVSGEITHEVIGDVDDFDPSEAETVTLDSKWNDFFDTNEYVTFDATVAQPIEQPYIYDGKVQTFRKDESELKRAQAQIDNLPWTTGHPDNGRITTLDEVKGFWKDPHWNDGQKATLHIPANDPDSVRFAVNNGDVSVGFSGRLDWTDDDSSNVDAVQRDMAYDHIASVENGRCSQDDGCGISPTLDSAENDEHGHVVDINDQIRSELTEEQMERRATRSDGDGPQGLSEGDWVQWQTNPQMFGKIQHIDTERQVVMVELYERSDDELVSQGYTLSAAYGDVVPMETKNGRPANDALPSASVCGCSEGSCSCGMHIVGDATINGTEIDLSVPEAAQSAAQAYLDAKEKGSVPDDCGTGAGTTSAEMIANDEVTAQRLIQKIAPYLSRHEQYIHEDWPHPTEWSEEQWSDCGDAQYASWGWTSLRDWAFKTADKIKKARGEELVYTDDSTNVTQHNDQEWSSTDGIRWRGTRDGDLDKSQIPNDEYESHYVFDGETKSKSSFPLVDADGYLRRENVIAAASYASNAPNTSKLMDVLREVNDEFDDPPLEEETLMNDDLSATDYSVSYDGDVNPVAQTSERFDDKQEKTESMTDTIDDPTEFYDGQPDVETLSDDFDAVAMLVDEKEKLEETVEDLQDEVSEYRRETFEDKAEKLTDITDTFGDVDTLVEQFENDELTLDELDERLQLASDIAGSETTTVNDDETTVTDDEDLPFDMSRNGRFKVSTKFE